MEEHHRCWRARGQRFAPVRRGLTRAEVITLGVIVLTALAIFLPYTLRQRTSSRRTFCENRQMHLARGLILVAETEGRFPGWREVVRPGSPQSTSWVFPLLPYLDRKYDQDELLGKATPDSARFGPHRELAETLLQQIDSQDDAPPVRLLSLLCPDDPRLSKGPTPPGALSYVANAGLPDNPQPQAGLPPDWPANGVFLDHFPSQNPSDEVAEKSATVTLSFISDHDGLQYTLLLSENLDAGQWWHNPTEATVGFVWVPGFVDGQADPGPKLLRQNVDRGKGDGSIRFARPSSLHVGGVVVAFCDGRTQFFSDRMDYLVFAQLMTPDGANVREAGSETPLPPPYRTEPQSE